MVFVETTLKEIPGSCFSLSPEGYYEPNCPFYNAEYDRCAARTDDYSSNNEQNQVSHRRPPTWCPLRDTNTIVYGLE